jgi:DNA primase
MTQQIDFVKLKQTLSIDRAAELLGLHLKKHGGQLRGPCPICKEGGDRALAVTPSRGLYYCFGKCRTGGDMITLAAGVRGCSPREGAEFLAEKSGVAKLATNGSNSSPQPTLGEGKLKPLDYLEGEHELVQALGVSQQTAAHFEAGYAPKGIMRGRLAIPLHDQAGVLLAYCGRALKGESPTLLFPNGFDPRGVLFNAHRIIKGDLFLVRDPLQVLGAFENGIENVVAFLTDNITTKQLEQLVALMNQRKCDGVEVF